MDRTTFADARIIDYDEAMDRFGDNDALFRRLAGKFTNDTHLAELEEALGRDDMEASYRAAHSLKGVAGNLSFTRLYLIAAAMSDALYEGDRTVADELMSDAKAAQARVLDALADLDAICANVE